jgi:hypothetical protein
MKYLPGMRLLEMIATEGGEAAGEKTAAALSRILEMVLAAPEGTTSFEISADDLIMLMDDAMVARHTVELMQKNARPDTPVTPRSLIEGVFRAPPSDTSGWDDFSGPGPSPRTLRSLEEDEEL